MSDHTNGETMEAEQKEKAETEPEIAEEKMDTTEEAKKEDDDEVKKEEEEDEEEEEEESSDEEELPLGSVEAPVQIMTGKRDRKKTERLVMVETPKTPEKKFEIPVGRGKPLGAIPMICYYLDKFKIPDLKPLHKFLYGKNIREVRETKKNIKLFTGFSFEKDDPEYAKREALLCKFTVEGIKELCTILDVEKKGTKDKIMERLMDFCMNPQSSDRKPPEKGPRGRKKGSTKKNKPKKSKSSKKKSRAGGDASTVSEDGDTTMEETTTEGEEGKDSSTADESTPAKTKAKSTPKPKKEKSAKNKDTPKTKSPKKKKISVKTPKAQTKKSTPVKSKKTPQKRKLEDIVDDDSSDDEPLVKKTKQPPTEKEIRTRIEQILTGADLEEVTMKMVCREVYAAFPEFPLQHKKDFIKATVREIIS